MVKKEPDIPTLLGTYSHSIGNAFPLYREYVPGKEGMKSHYGGNEWDSYCVDNEFGTISLCACVLAGRAGAFLVQ